MNRRQFHARGAAVLATCAAPIAHARVERRPPTLWQELEQKAQGRLGVAVLDTADGKLYGHRLDERFAMCSTFKWLAAALVLHRVDKGQEQLDRRIAFGKERLLRHSPVTSQHAGGPGMTLAELCDAAVTVSDNAAGNLLLESFGGPAALTRYARTLGDAVTRLDRWELELNEATPGDPRDTTTPRAMAGLLNAVVLEDALSMGSREQLVRWLRASRSNAQRLGAHVPAGWHLGSKTGSGSRGTTNDVGVFWRPSGKPIVIAVYLTQSGAPDAVRNGVIADVARALTARA